MIGLTEIDAQKGGYSGEKDSNSKKGDGNDSSVDTWELGSHTALIDDEMMAIV